MLTKIAMLTMVPVLAVVTSTISITACAVPEPITVAICSENNLPKDTSFKQDYFSADGTVETLLLTKAASNCKNTQIPVDGKILWAGLASAESLKGPYEQIGLQGDFSSAPYVISETIVIKNDQAKPTPEQSPAAERQSMSSTEPAQNADRVLQRGAWLWSPELWRNKPEFIWQTQTQEQLSEIYISVPIDEDGDIPDAAELAQFITQASSRSLQVWVVIGDPHDVLPAHQAALERRINAFLSYNKSASKSAQLAGIQLDIEPYLLPGFTHQQARWRERYVAVIKQVHQLINGQMRMDLVMPAWWGIHPAWGESLFSALPSENTRISIMNYHTGLERLKTNAEPFLDWGKRKNVPIQIALELGFLKDEHQRRYRSHADTGELWLVSVGDQQVFLLFDRPQTKLKGKAFSYAFEFNVPASLFTFAGNKVRLNQAIDDLENNWRLWLSFSGISVHGLDDKNFSEGAQ